MPFFAVSLSLNPRAWWAAVATCASLTACGGGGSDGSGTPSAGTPPVIAVPPQAQTVVEGQSARFAVVASAASPPSYQWQRNGVTIEGATQAAYVTPPLAPTDTGVQFRVVVSAGGLGTVSAPAVASVLGDASLPAPVVSTVAPSTVAAAQSDAFGAHVVVRNPAVLANGLLFVFFPGTGARPENYQLIVQAAANNGFAAIGLAYPNESTVSGACTGNPNPDCTRLIRDETLSGTDASPLVAVSVDNSIRNRLASLLGWLARQQPQAGWSQFLDGAGQLRWNLVRASGHSQGGGSAVHLSKLEALDRACFFAAPGDSSDGTSGARWVAAAGATPPARLYGLAHVQDGIIPNSLLLAEWSALQLGGLGAPVSVDGATPPFGGSHQLLTSVPRGNLLTPAALAFHNLPVVDAFTPMSGGLPSLRRVWQTLCFTP